MEELPIAEFIKSDAVVTEETIGFTVNEQFEDPGNPEAADEYQDGRFSDSEDGHGSVYVAGRVAGSKDLDNFNSETHDYRNLPKNPDLDVNLNNSEVWNQKHLEDKQLNLDKSTDTENINDVNEPDADYPEGSDTSGKYNNFVLESYSADSPVFDDVIPPNIVLESPRDECPPNSADGIDGFDKISEKEKSFLSMKGN